MVSKVVPELHVDAVQLVIFNPSELNEVVEGVLETLLEVVCEVILHAIEDLFDFLKVVFKELSDEESCLSAENFEKGKLFLVDVSMFMVKVGSFCSFL